MGAGGDLLLLAAALGAFFLLLVYLQTWLLAPVVWGGFLFGLFVLGSLNLSMSPQGLRHSLALFGGLATFFFFARFGAILARRQGWRWAVYALCLAAIVLVYGSGLPKNITGGTMIYLLAVIAILAAAQGYATVTTLLLFGAITAICLGLDFRAMLGYAAIGAAVVVAMRFLPAQLIFVLGASGAMGIITGVIWYVTHVESSALAAQITALIESYSGRRATSGRDWLWPAILNAVSISPWQGLGAGVRPSDFLSTDYSSHSTYMQTLLQVGYLGLFCLAGFLISVWRQIVRFGQDPIGRLTASLFIIFVMHNSSEVIMFQNAMIAAVPAWAALGMGLSLARQREISGASLGVTAPAGVKSIAVLQT